MAGLRGSRDNAGRYAHNNIVYNLYVIFACAQKYHRYDVQITGYTTPSQKFVHQSRQRVVLHTGHSKSDDRAITLYNSRLSGYIGFDLTRGPIKSNNIFFICRLIHKTYGYI